MALDPQSAPASPPWLEVAAGVVIDRHGRLLLGQRPEGKAYAGWWELPGGKLEPGETPLQALVRELKEEVGIDVTEVTPWVTHVHTYPHATVRLSFCRVTAWQGEPQGLENQALAWVNPQVPVAELEASLGGGSVLPATLPPLAWLQIPNRYLILALEHAADMPGYWQRLEQALAAGVRLFQFRAPAWFAGVASPALLEVLRKTVQLAHAVGAKVLINSVHPELWWAQADGVHLRSSDLLTRSVRPSDVGVLAASCHDAEQLAKARALAADFAVLGPVLPTLSHPGAAGLGWKDFTALNASAGFPVFAVGGQSPATLADALQHGAHGIAGIRQLLA